MKKTIVLILLAVFIFIPVMNVKAQTHRFDNTVNIDYLEGQSDYANCDGLFTQDGLDMIKEILSWIRIIGPILVILLISLDLASAVMSQDNDALSKAQKKIIPRLIGTALLFFVPTIVRAILGLKGVNDTLVISDDPLCHTMITEPAQNDYEYLI